MSDPSDQRRDPEQAESVPTPARPAAAPPTGASGGGPPPARGAGGGGRRRGRRSGSSRGSDGERGGPATEGSGDFKPTPVRAVVGTESSTSTLPAEEGEAELSVDGETWVARVIGCSGGRSGVAVPLLLLGFWPTAHAEGAPHREALVVGRTLAGMSEGALARAWSTSREPPPPPPPARPDRRRRRGVGDSASGGESG